MNQLKKPSKIKFPLKSNDYKGDLIDPNFDDIQDWELTQIERMNDYQEKNYY